MYIDGQHLIPFLDVFPKGHGKQEVDPVVVE
jgi:hypothetical protein